jgi:CheY-like chemotaxis protein
MEQFLKSKLGSKFFVSFKANHIDRRVWIDAASKALGMNSAELWMEFSEKNGTPFIAVIPEMNFGDKDEETLFIRYASIPIVDTSGSVLGIASIDPVWAKKHLSEYAIYDWYTSSWELIAARYRAKTNLLSDKVKIHAQEVKPEEILEKICKTVDGIDYQKIVISPMLARYQIVYGAGETAFGELHERIINSLNDYLSIRLDQKKSVTLSINESPFLLSKDISNEFVLEKISKPQAGIIHQFPPLFRDRSDSVLLVDDNKSFLQIVSQYLTKQGIKVSTAIDGDKALTFLEEQTLLPSVIVCDLHMPNKNGFEFIQTLKSDERYQSIPVISLTSDKDVEAEISLLTLGVAAFISKNEDPRILALHVRRHLPVSNKKKAA